MTFHFLKHMQARFCAKKGISYTDPEKGGRQQKTKIQHCVMTFSFPEAHASELAVPPEMKKGPIGLFVFCCGE